eukprot:PhF_6_TR34188/c1_g1_i3/m.50066
MARYGGLALVLALSWGGNLVALMEITRALTFTNDPMVASLVWATVGSLVWCLILMGCYMGLINRGDPVAVSLIMTAATWVFMLSCGVSYAVLNMQRNSANDFSDPGRILTIHCDDDTNASTILTGSTSERYHYLRFGTGAEKWFVDMSPWKQKTYTIASTGEKSSRRLNYCGTPLRYNGTGVCSTYVLYATCMQQLPLSATSIFNCDPDTLYDKCLLYASPHEVTMRTFNDFNLYYANPLNAWSNVLKLTNVKVNQSVPTLLVQYASLGPGEFEPILDGLDKGIAAILATCYTVFFVLTLIGIMVVW